MNRIDRLTAILLMLQEKPRTSEQIAGHFEVSKRTILRDMAALYEIGVPIISREGAGGGYSLSPQYRIASPPLTTQEAYLLLLSLSAVSRLRSAPFASKRTSLLAKIRSTLPPQQLQDVDRLLSISSLAMPRREQGTPFLDPLMKAAAERQWVRVTYRSARRLSTQHLLPTSLSSQNGFWYCRAYSHERHEERNYRVDRIQSLEPAQQGFSPGVLPQRPYDDPQHPQVVAALTAGGVLHMETEPDIGHLVQRVEDGTGKLEFRCPPGELAYFARFFAGLGPEAEVIAPEELRLALAELGQQLIEKYQKR